jgi:uncharacterized protein YkwD
LDARKFLKT